MAAIRETFEESGILLARRRGEPETLQPHEAKEVAAHRLELQAGKISFREVIEQHDLELATDQLAMHAHWITPEPVPRRFDTLFFTVLAPAGQQARHDGVETTDHLWIRPEDALAEMRAGERRIIFPTAMNLETLRGFSSAEEVLEASRKRRVVPITPALEERGGRRFIVIPPDAGYPYHEAPVDKP